MNIIRYDKIPHHSNNSSYKNVFQLHYGVAPLYFMRRKPLINKVFFNFLKRLFCTVMS